MINLINCLSNWAKSCLANAHKKNYNDICKVRGGNSTYCTGDTGWGWATVSFPGSYGEIETATETHKFWDFKHVSAIAIQGSEMCRKTVQNIIGIINKRVGLSVFSVHKLNELF